VGGSVTTLASLAKRRRRYNPKLVHGFRLKLDTVNKWVKRFRKMKVSEIQKLIPFDEKRAGVLPAGTVLLAQVCKHLKVEELTVSHRGLRWGVAREWCERRISR
jgi:exopolyphosphatase/guanosine-5'-triphosphate,3'-diphosphate pyrophosphatase